MKVAHDLRSLTEHYSRLVMLKEETDTLWKTLVFERLTGRDARPDAKWVECVAKVVVATHNLTKWENDNLKGEV